MILREVNLPASRELGLKAISLKRLGQVVVLAGKNGAGKTRVLTHLEQYCSKAFDLGDYVSLTNLGKWVCAKLRKETLSEVEIEDYIRRYGVGGWELLANWRSIKLEPLQGFQFSRLSPAPPGLADVRSQPLVEMESLSDAATNSPISALGAQALSRIQDLQNQWFHARSRDVELTKEERAQAEAAYDKLQQLIEALLGARLGRQARGHITLFGKPIGDAGLSDGQRVLLLWAVMLHSQVDHLCQTVILCDEPENHLHPHALIDAIERITVALPQVQLWIATHSLPLLSHFDPSSIYWVEDGGVEFAGTKPLKVLRGLLGDDGRIGRLHDFLGLPANLAANRFAAQCLVEPAVSDRGEGDPQTRQIRDLLAGLKPGEPLRLLDFGAGRGRLAADLHAAAAQSEGLKGRFDYVAYDPGTDHKDELTQRVRDLQGDETGRVFSDFSTLTDTRGRHSFDVVVMCNVLHEIPVGDWLSLFGHGRRLLDLLAPGGHLLIVEDTLMPVGESPHPGGFLVLETTPLCAFLNCQPTDFQKDVAESNHRLVAHLIPRALLERPTLATLREALKQTATRSGERIDDLRSPGTNPGADGDGNARYRAGREHAFHVHQFSNATRALHKLGGT